MDEFEVSYALCKQVPAMRREVRLETDYGALVLVGHEAMQVAAVVERLLNARWRRLQRQQALSGGDDGDSQDNGD